MQRVGFSGTSSGMTVPQRTALRKLLTELGATELHHGDCVGADDQAADDAYSMGLRVASHPPSDTVGRAYNEHSHEVRDERTHFLRNRNIVDATDCLVIAPWSAERQAEGGTWYTHDYAVKKRRDVYIVCPDGTVTCGGATWPKQSS